MHQLFKRQKWSHLVVNSGQDRFKVPIFSACAGSRKVPLLKTLMSSFCKNDCKFCALRCERKFSRERWEPTELANITMKLWRWKKIDGLFLSSSVDKDPDIVVERELECVRILRKIGFTDYVHLRLMPSVSRDLIKQSVDVADRIGINIEFPKSEHYNDMKIFLNFRQDIIRRMKWISREVDKVQKDGKCKAGIDSQMVVGASNETDKEILQVSEWLYNKIKARRVYYSAFEPIENTPMEYKEPENRWREYRLYQSSFLIQKYNFTSKKFVFNDDMLTLNEDPKITIARNNDLKVDINNANFDELIKVPGIGIKAASNILEKRPIENLEHLKKLGILKRAIPFIIFKNQSQTKLSHWLS